MHPLLQTHRDAVAGLCRSAGVRRLEVFGSAARGDFDDQRSDLDFLIEFDDANPKPVLQTYFSLKQALEALFQRPVDLLMPGAIDNPYLRADIDRSRQLVYAA